MLNIILNMKKLTKNLVKCRIKGKRVPLSADTLTFIKKSMKNNKKTQTMSSNILNSN